MAKPPREHQAAGDVTGGVVSTQRRKDGVKPMKLPIFFGEVTSN